MKTNFNISESEKKQILELHNVIRESLNSKLSKERIDEQATPQLKGVDLLKAARDKGCKIAVGAVLKSAPGKPTVLYKVADYDSKNGYFVKGDEIYIKDDMTFDVVKNQNGVKTLSAQNKPWACAVLFEKGPDPNAAADREREIASGIWTPKDKLTNVSNAELAQLYERHPLYPDLYKLKGNNQGKQGNYTPEQEAWIKVWKNTTDPVTGQVMADMYKTSLTDEEKATQAYVPVIAPGSEKVFPNGGLTVYYNPNKASTVTSSVLNTILTNQTITRDACRKNVMDYYLAFTRRNSVTIPGKSFDEAKKIVQNCADSYYKNWGLIGSLKKGEGNSTLDKNIDILRGGMGGPSAYGDDAKWKLK